MKSPIFQKLDARISAGEALIKEYQLIEQKIDIAQRSGFRVQTWKVNLKKLSIITRKIDSYLSQLTGFYNANQNTFADNTNVYIREYIKYFKSVSYAANLRTNIQKNVITDCGQKGQAQKGEATLKSRLEDIHEMTVALKKCEQNAVSVNKIVAAMRSNNPT
ncbi:MAG: hypothetical protein WA949_23605 [Phormidesmis sp.]